MAKNIQACSKKFESCSLRGTLKLTFGFFFLQFTLGLAISSLIPINSVVVISEKYKNWENACLILKETIKTIHRDSAQTPDILSRCQTYYPGCGPYKIIVFSQTTIVLVRNNKNTGIYIDYMQIDFKTNDR